MATLERAIEIAYEAHRGEFRRDGQPSVIHPLRVMGALAMADYDETTQIVGVLHDVVEDNPEWTLERLANEGFSGEIIDALDALTNKEGKDPNSYMKYIDTIAKHALGRVVKTFDIFDNLLDNPTTKQREKYPRALARLGMPAQLFEEEQLAKAG